MEWINAFFKWFADNKDGVISLGVFIAAIASIGGAVWATRISTKSARQEQLGKIRQVWVESLRDDISTLLKVHSIDSDLPGDTNSTKNFIASRILLRLTSEDKCHARLSAAVKDFVFTMYSEKQIDHTKREKSQQAADELIEAAKIVLKEAWDQAAGDLS